jgi:hypothetical protein
LGNATEKNLYDLNSHYYINTVKHNDNLKEISLKRFKQENIEKLRKELKSHPEINLDELGIHRNFEKNIKGCLRKDLVEEFHKRTSKYISEKKEEKLSLLKLQEIRKNSLSVLEKVIKDTEIKT